MLLAGLGALMWVMRDVSIPNEDITVSALRREGAAVSLNKADSLPSFPPSVYMADVMGCLDNIKAALSSKSDAEVKELALKLLQLDRNTWSPDQQFHLAAALSVMADRDPVKALAFYSQSADEQLILDWGDHLFPGIAAKAPKEMVSWALSKMDSPRALDLLYLSCGALGERNFDHALVLINSCSRNETDKKSLLRSSLIALSKKKPAEALQRASQLPQDQQSGAMGAVVEGLSRSKNYPELVALLAAPNSGLIPASDLNRVFSEWVKGDAKAAMDAFPQLNARQQWELAKNNQLLQILVEQKPESAVKLLNNADLTNSNRNQIANLVSALSRKNPNEALAWISSLPDSVNKDVFYGQSLTTWAAFDADGFKTMLSQNPEFLSNKKLIDSAAQGMAMHDLTEAIEYVKKIPDTNKLAFLTQVLHTGALNSPAEAAEAVTSNPALLTNADLCSKIAGSYAKTNLENAKQWISSLTGSSHAAATGALIKSWCSTDSVAASTWLRDLPNGDAKIQGVKTLINEIKDSDAESAAVWKTSLDALEAARKTQ